MNIAWYRYRLTPPPDNNEMIIAHAEGEGYQVGTGAMLRNLLATVTINRHRVNPTWKWTRYSDDLWSHLKDK